MKKMFLLFDGRALTEGPDEAVVLDTACSEAEARREGRSTYRGYDAVWVEYDVLSDLDGNHLINETMRRDLPPINQRSDR